MFSVVREASTTGKKLQDLLVFGFFGILGYVQSPFLAGLGRLSPRMSTGRGSCHKTIITIHRPCFHEERRSIPESFA